jgi:hypothetical protein
MKLEFSRQIFAEYSKIKFHENPCSGSQGVPYEDRRTDMTKLIIAFRNFAKAIEILSIIHMLLVCLSPQIITPMPSKFVGKLFLGHI